MHEIAPSGNWGQAQHLKKEYQMTVYTQDELYATMRERFGTDDKAWAWQCPHCGDIANAYDFAAVMNDDWAKVAGAIGQECIGRHTETRGCDWAAYGLFAGPNVTVMRDPDGKERRIWCFNIAPDPAETGDAA